MDSMSQEIQPFLSLYTHAFPIRDHIQVTNCVNVSTGWEGDLLCLGLAYMEEGQLESEEVILKLYYGQDGIRKARQEFDNLHQLSHVGYPVPGPLFAALEASPFGRAAVAMKKIQGETAAHLFSLAQPERQQELVTQCCQLYLDLHRLDWASFIPNPARYRTRDVIPAWIARAQAQCTQWLPGTFEPIIAWLQKRSGEVTCQSLSLVHGDFHLDNILIRDDGTAYVIDWTGTDISDYRFDLAWTLLLRRAEGATELASMILKTYEQLAGFSIEQLAFFEVTACLKRLFDIATSLQNGASAFGMKPGAEEDMRQQMERSQIVYHQLQKLTGCSLPAIEHLLQEMDR